MNVKWEHPLVGGNPLFMGMVWGMAIGGLLFDPRNHIKSTEPTEPVTPTDDGATLRDAFESFSE